MIERFGAAGVAPEQISCVRDTYMFNFAGSPVGFVDAFRRFYGPTMNAFEAAEKNGKADELKAQLEALFTEQNTSADLGRATIPATFLRVNVEVI